MNIVTEPPAIYDRAKDVFGLDFVKDKLVMTYGENVHTHTGHLSDDLVAHEQTHIDQQSAYEGGPAAWWERYLVDPQWRLEQELQAYRKQWQWMLKHEPNRQKRFDTLRHCAQCLSGHIYGNIISLSDAMKRIRE